MTTQIEAVYNHPDSNVWIHVWTFSSDDDRRTWQQGRFQTRGRGHVIIVDDHLAGTFEWHEYDYEAPAAMERARHFNEVLVKQKGWTVEHFLY